MFLHLGDGRFSGDPKDGVKWQWLVGEKMVERLGSHGEVEGRADHLISGADLEPSTQQAVAKDQRG